MSQKNMGRLAQDMKREVIAIIGRLKDPRLEGGLLTVTRLDGAMRKGALLGSQNNRMRSRWRSAGWLRTTF